MKKITAIILLTVLILLISAACGENAGDTGINNQNNPDNQAENNGSP